MKTRSRFSRSGFALVLVLITIVLVTAMAAFFLSTVGRERRGVALYASSSETGRLSGMAVSRVMAQISAATREGTASAPVAWASQPGMIRTFEASAQKNIYKLYSWDTDAVKPGAGFDPGAASETPPANWKDQTAAFTDLNQPVNGIYPILDPAALGHVEGFSINATAAAVSGSGLSAPMPVRWLYVLEDGQLVEPTGGGSSVTVGNATAANPIVGRIAFWTDDETSKVNVNTASEGAYWDWPKAATYNEMQFAGNPPVGGEFNRLPGHPAMTSLSAVFPTLSPGNRWADVGAYRTKLQTLLDISPRVRYDNASSRGGTYPIEAENFVYGPTGTLPPIPSLPLTPKAERLFVSPDEMVFSAVNRVRQPALSASDLRSHRFFLTAHSRAPETTLFETPRVSLWPITWAWNSAHTSTQRLTNPGTPDPNTASLDSNEWMRPEERLLAFDATLNRLRNGGGDKYYFQRQNQDSPTHDYANITRNQNLLTYLQGLTNKPLPGWGAALTPKWSASTRDSILVNTFNSIRSLVNQYTLADDGRMLYSFTPVAFTQFKYKNGTIKRPFSERGAFSPIPVNINLGSGDVTALSEFPTLREAALVFFATGRDAPVFVGANATEKNNPFDWTGLINITGAGGYPVGAQTKEMKAVLLLDFSSIEGSSRSNQPVFWIKLSGGSLNAGGQSLSLGNAVAKMDYQARGDLLTFPTYLRPLYKKDADGVVTDSKTFNNGSTDDNNYGLISNGVSLQPSAIEFPFTGNTITIEIYGVKNGDPSIDPTGDPTLRVGTYTVDFSGWSGNLPIPLMPWWNLAEVPAQGGNSDGWCPSPRFDDYANNDNPDVVPNVPPTKWAAMDIAPLYRSSWAHWDPVMGGSGNVMSIWPPTLLFKKPATDKGNFTNNATGNYQPAYARAGQQGAVASDFGQRIKLMNNWGSFTALKSGGSLVPRSDGQSGGFPVITPYDTVISVIPKSAGPGNGDPRLATKFEFEKSSTALTGSMLRLILPLDDYFGGRNNRQYHTLGVGGGTPSATGYIVQTAFTLLGSGLAPDGMAVVGGSSKSGTLGNGSATVGDEDAILTVSARTTASLSACATVGDWTSQPGVLPDGGVFTRTDQDFQALTSNAISSPGFTYQTPYFRLPTGSFKGVDALAARGNFSPNRQIASPITLLGQIPSSTTTGWQTLAFSPNPAAGSSHPGLTSPPDYLFLDFFWMPVAEPYPISEEFSTAGKINLNSQILPFSYIHRDTGLHALLKSTWITAINTSLARNYKSHDFVRQMPNSQTRYPVDPTETIKLFHSQIFDQNLIFRAAAQICSMWLVPQGRTAANVQGFWSTTDQLLTSDTGREAPYDHIYSRATTKSNTYTVHWRVQSLKKSAANNPNQWDDTTDKVQAEARGSTLIERYLDPDATTTPDYATNPNAAPLTQFYKWRVAAENYFP